MKGFPIKIYVQWFEDESGSWLMADFSINGANEADLGKAVAGEHVGIYELKQVGTIKQAKPVFVPKK